MQIHLIFWVVLALSSKHPPFLSFQIVHQIQDGDGIILHQFFCLLLSSSWSRNLTDVLYAQALTNWSLLNEEQRPQLRGDLAVKK